MNEIEAITYLTVSIVGFGLLFAFSVIENHQLEEELSLSSTQHANQVKGLEDRISVLQNYAYYREIEIQQQLSEQERICRKEKILIANNSFIKDRNGGYNITTQDITIHAIGMTYREVMETCAHEATHHHQFTRMTLAEKNEWLHAFWDETEFLNDNAAKDEVEYLAEFIESQSKCTNIGEMI